jgi:NAD(P)-dependent dehydrogenase (short-subunit alcohol dehydrogenase family)
MIGKCISITVALVSIVIGLLVSGVLRQTDLVANFAARYVPHLIGLTPIMLTLEQHKNAFQVDSLPRLDGKIAIVTGGNSGVGYESVKALAGKGAHVIMGCRSMSKCKTASEAIKGGKVTPMLVDTSSLKSVEEFTSKFMNKFDRLDILMLNAGIVFYEGEPLSVDGVELVFATNYLGHFKMTLDLLKVLEATAQETHDARIVSVSSGSHFSPIPEIGVYLDLEEMNKPSNFQRMPYYGQSKLAQVLFTQQLASQLEGKSIFVNSMHPGAVATNIWGPLNNFPGIKDFLFWSTADGARTQIYLAASPEVKEQKINGEYYHPITTKMEPSSEFAGKGSELPKKLWLFSEQILRERGFLPKN